MEKISTIYVRLLDEGIEVFRPVQALYIKEQSYSILDHDYDPETETWEFLPGTVVQTDFIINDQGEKFLAAIKKI